MFNKNKIHSVRGQKISKSPRKGTNSKFRAGFSLIELVIVIAILAILIAVLAPSLMTYTERSRAQKDVTTMDEVVNAVQLAMADQKCYDEMIKYSCSNNFITYTDSSGNYGQVIADGEFWAPDGSGRATTITFNPTRKGNETFYVLETGIVNDMTYGNGSVAENRVMQGAQTNNQCYFKNAVLNGEIDSYTYNRVRQIVGDSTIATSATYANSSFTIFIRFNQKDGVTVADVNGSFNGTNLTADAPASKGSGTISYDKETGAAKPTVTTPGTVNSNFTGSALQGGGSFNGNIGIKDYVQGSIEIGEIIPEGGTYYVKVTSINVGENTGYEEKLVAGDPFPKTVNDNDVFVYGDYEYRYNNTRWSYDSAQYNGRQNGAPGWSVMVFDTTKTSYGPILNSINQKPITKMGCTFAHCSNIIESPKIPSTVDYMVGTYYGSSLQIAADIPDSVTVLTCAFSYTPIKQCPTLPKNLQSAVSAFYLCNKIKSVPNLPEGLEIATNMFTGCYNLQSIPTIPSSITQMTSMFENCYKLSGNVKINASPQSYDKCFYTPDGLNGQKIWISGESTVLNELAATDGYTDFSVNDRVRVKPVTKQTTLHVSYVEWDNRNQKYNHFYDEIEITYEDGMTWSSWIASEYNTTDLQISQQSILNPGIGFLYHIEEDEWGMEVDCAESPTDIISDQKYYHITDWPSA